MLQYDVQNFAVTQYSGFPLSFDRVLSSQQWNKSPLWKLAIQIKYIKRFFLRDFNDFSYNISIKATCYGTIKFVLFLVTLFVELFYKFYILVIDSSDLKNQSFIL